jgi:hypothetical protein
MEQPSPWYSIQPLGKATMESKTISIGADNGLESTPEPAGADPPTDAALACDTLSPEPSPLKPVTAAVEAAHFEALNRQIKLLTEANERMVRIVRRQLFSASLFVSFVRGMALGLGWVFGTTLVVGMIVIFLHHFDSAPWVGEYVRRIIGYLQAKPDH